MSAACKFAKPKRSCPALVVGQRNHAASIAIEKSCDLTQEYCVAQLPALDELDHRLLDLLQRDATVTLAELGDAVGLSASAVQRRIVRYRKSGLMRQIAVLDASVLPAVTLAAVWVTMERDTFRLHSAFRARMRSTPEVQQCYAVAGQWDYLVILVARSVAHYREVAERLFVDEGTVKRYETRLVFDTIKQGLNLPTRPPARRRK